jgi:hypothetical protein
MPRVGGLPSDVPAHATVGVGRSTSRWPTADVAGHVEQAEPVGEFRPRIVDLVERDIVTVIDALLIMTARTAVVAGTATAVSGSVARRQQAKAQATTEQHAPSSGPPVEPAAGVPTPPQPAAPPAPETMLAELERLVELKQQGLLTDDEFAALSTPPVPCCCARTGWEQGSAGRPESERRCCDLARATCRVHPGRSPTGRHRYPPATVTSCGASIESSRPPYSQRTMRR